MKKCIQLISGLFLVAVSSETGSCQTTGLYDSMYVQWVQDVRPFQSSSIDVPAGLAVDPEGNLYVTGKSENVGADFDFLTIKSSSTGNELWRVVYDGPEQMADIPIDIAVDDAGNAFVTGMSVAANSNSFDIVTIRYGEHGIMEWISRYDGPAHSLDAPVSIALLQSGGVVVTGFQSDGLNRDIATIKYSPEGSIDWIRSYDGPDHLDDRPHDLVVGSTGNITLCGVSQEPTEGSGARSVLVLIQYDQDGAEQWISGFTPADPSAGIRPAAMAVGSDGSLSIAANQFGQWSSLVRDEEIMALKFNRLGALLWVNTFGKPSTAMEPVTDLAVGIALDSQGDIYLSGMTGPYTSFQQAGENLVTVKYSSDGWEKWARFYAAAEGEVVRAAGVQVGPDDKPIVAATFGRMTATHQPEFTGTSSLLLSYGSEGTLLWEEESSDGLGVEVETTGMIIDSDGNILTAGTSGHAALGDFLVRKHFNSGQAAWESVATGTGKSISFVMDAVVDGDGTIYACGTTVTPVGHMNLCIWAIDPDGNILWSGVSDVNDLSSYPSMADIVLTDDRRVVAASALDQETILTSYDIVTGNELWETTLETPYGFIVDDPSGNIILSGFRTILKIDQSGSVLWTLTIQEDASPFSQTDMYGNVYSSINGAISKYDPDGNNLWASSIVLHSFFTVDDSGYVYGNIDEWPSYRLTRITPEGVPTWEVDTEYGLTFFVGERAFVGANDHLSAFSTSGEPLWSNQIPPNAFWWKQFAARPAGEAFVTGTFLPDNSFDWEVRTQRIQSDGTALPPLVFGAGGPDGHKAEVIGIDTLGNLYVVGDRVVPGGITSPFVIKYGSRNVATSATAGNAENPQLFQLYQNYPNPFNPSSVITFSLPKGGHVSLEVYNLLGQKVATLADEVLDAGTHHRRFDGSEFSSGMYVYRLASNGYVATRKMLLVK